MSPSTAFKSLTMRSLFLASSVCCRAHAASDSLRSASRLLLAFKKYLQEGHASGVQRPQQLGRMGQASPLARTRGMRLHKGDAKAQAWNQWLM